MTFLSKLRKNAETILFGPAPPKRNYQYSYTPGSSVYETSTQDTPAQASSLNTVGSNNTPGAHAQSRNAPAPDSSIHPGAPKRDTQSLPHLKICSTPESPFLQFPDKDWAVMSRLDLLDKDQQKLLSQEDGAMLEEIFDLLAKEDIREILAKKREEEREEEERRRNPLRSQSVEDFFKDADNESVILSPRRAKLYPPLKTETEASDRRSSHRFRNAMETPEDRVQVDHQVIIGRSHPRQVYIRKTDGNVYKVKRISPRGLEEQQARKYRERLVEGEVLEFDDPWSMAEDVGDVNDPEAMDIRREIKRIGGIDKRVEKDWDDCSV